MNTESLASAIRIAVISDTHGRLPASVASALAGADEIWHLGDFCDAATFDAVRRIGPPVVAVLGNNDYTLDLPREERLVRGKSEFRLIHIPPRVFAPGSVWLHGHTHVPRNEVIGGVRVLNPGTVGKPDKGAAAAWAWLTIRADGGFDWEPVAVQK